MDSDSEERNIVLPSKVNVCRMARPMLYLVCTSGQPLWHTNEAYAVFMYGRYPRNTPTFWLWWVDSQIGARSGERRRASPTVDGICATINTTTSTATVLSKKNNRPCSNMQHPCRFMVFLVSRCMLGRRRYAILATAVAVRGDSAFRQVSHDHSCMIQ